MRETFREIKFRPDSLERIELCNQIIEDYQEQGLRLTLRQLYYQLVTKNAVMNTERSYKNLSTLVSDARLAGVMDWDAIEDRVRAPRYQSEFLDLQDLIDSSITCYRLPRWEGQPYYAELWVEKDALAGVLSPLAAEFHVTLMVNRGYSSQSAMYESAQRFMNSDRDPILFYLGDHDPSGEDMVRDIEERLRMFGVDTIIVIKLALTMEQVKKYNPPPNPAKIDDPRAAAYIREHGNYSWEVDALPPELLTKIIRGKFNSIIDKDLMDEIINREESDKKAMRLLAKRRKK